MKTFLKVIAIIVIFTFIFWSDPKNLKFPLGVLIMIIIIAWAKSHFQVDEENPRNDDYNLKL